MEITMIGPDIAKCSKHTGRMQLKAVLRRKLQRTGGGEGC